MRFTVSLNPAITTLETKVLFILTVIVFKLSAGITFLPMGLGGSVAAALLPLCERFYVRRCKAAGGPVPEARLLPTFFVAPLVAAGLL